MPQLRRSDTLSTRGPGDHTEQSEEFQKIRERVRKKFDEAERVQKLFRDRWDIYYGLYRNFRRLQSAVANGDHDPMDLMRKWRAQLFIPYSFSVVETIVPRVISQNPRMLVKPRVPEAKASATRVEELFEVQQREIDYATRLQSVARSGLKYGLGVGKTFWDSRTRKIKQNRPRAFRGGFKTVDAEVPVFQGPMFEPVNIWDFFWDPAAENIETAEYLIHRLWRPFEFVKRKVESGEWEQIDLESASKRAQGALWSEVHGNKLKAAGVGDLSERRQNLHEIWEFHDRENVYVVLDREMVVVNDVNPHFHRELPFQIFRPTPQEHEFVGIGEIEPIAHLQAELNTLRSQRRDNANLVMQKAFLYAEGFVDPDHFRVGPGVGIPVRGTNINDVVQALEFGELPASGYREEEAIKEDIERTTGVSEATAGGSGGGTAGSETATGIQLIQAAANVRIELKTKNLLNEVVQPAARQWLEMDRQFLIERSLRVPDPQADGGERFEQVGPNDLLQDFEEPIPAAGSTEPDNPAADQQQALTLWQAFGGNQDIDQRKLAEHVLRQFDVPDSESFMAPLETVPVNPRVLGEALAQQGIPQEMVIQALDAALSAATGQEPEAQEGGGETEELAELATPLEENPEPDASEEEEANA